MKKLLNKLLMLGAISLSTLSYADYCFPAYVGAESIDVVPISNVSPMINNLMVSPLYGKATMKQGSVKNDGWLYGIHGSYDLINYNSFYFGSEIGYKFGELKGKVSNIEELQINIDKFIIENKTKSNYSDLWAEFRAGFTIGGLNYTGGFITPYILAGYEQEKDNFVSPSPIEIKHKLTYGYFGGGLLSLFRVSNQMTIGAKVKFKWMFNATQKTGGDAYIENKEISCANCFHWSIEIPVNYLISPNLTMSLAPFYEYKNYDKHKFEWLGKEKATFNMWGRSITIRLYILMPKEWVAVNALTIQERQKIKEAIDMNMSYSEMGEYVGRDKSTVMREAKRLGHFSQYDPDKAQKDFESKQKLVGIKRNSPLYLKIKEEENLG